MSTPEDNAARLREAFGLGRPESNSAELLSTILPMIKTIVRVATAPEVARALGYNHRARDAVADFYSAVNHAASAARLVIVSLSSEDSAEYLARPVTRVTLSKR